MKMLKLYRGHKCIKPAFLMPSVLLHCHSSSPFSAYLNVRNLTN